MREVMLGAAVNVAKDVQVEWVMDTIHDIGYDKPAELAKIILHFLDGQ